MATNSPGKFGRISFKRNVIRIMKLKMNNPVTLYKFFQRGSRRKILYNHKMPCCFVKPHSSTSRQTSAMHPCKPYFLFAKESL